MTEADAAGPSDASDPRRWTRELGVLLALPAMWVDHGPREIATGLLSVLFGVLGLEGAFARFGGPSGGAALEVWRPHGAEPPPELRGSIDVGMPRTPGVATHEVTAPDAGILRVASLPLALPWETALVVVSASRDDFPNAMETHLLRVAVGQAAIAIHTAGRLAREHAARTAAEEALARRDAAIRSFIEDMEPSFAAASQRIAELSHVVDAAPLAPIARIDAVPAVGSAGDAVPAVGSAGRPAPGGGRTPLTSREAEVLGLLAQGLSNREIAGLMWLSDRTVERHVTSLYRKIGVARRSEATAYALRSGIVAP